MYNTAVDFLSHLECCQLCPRRCGVNRIRGELGFCGAGKDVVVSHYGPHFGEEPPLSGMKGSGNIFFSPCNLRCLFCQNYQISHHTRGKRISIEGLVETFFELQAAGVHNINLVSPTPYVPQIASAIAIAKQRGIALPFVYNTNAYENRESLELLRGLVDIYLPDFKYWSEGIGERLSSCKGYPEAARNALLEMKAQVGDLRREKGIARRGLLVRHLVLPNMLAGTVHIIEWISRRLGKKTFISLMSQYHPVDKALDLSLLKRGIREEEYERALRACEGAGLVNVFIQEIESATLFLPDFNQEEPFKRANSGRQ